MKLSTIINKLEIKYPTDMSLSFDNTGFLVGNINSNIKNIYICLDVTSKEIDNAILNKADLIISHHPLIFNEQKQVTSDDFVGKRIIKLLKNNINLYSIHTNYDIVSMNKDIIYKLNIKDFEILDEEENIGVIGIFKEGITLKKFIDRIKKNLHIENLSLYKSNDKLTKKIAIIPGSGKSFIDIAINKGCNIVFTGDVDYHSGIDSIEKGINIINANHYDLEKIFITNMKDYILKNFKNLNVICSNLKRPFEFL